MVKSALLRRRTVTRRGAEGDGESGFAAASILPLRLEAAEVRRGRNRLVGPIDLEIGASGVTMVIGPNGSGKTSLLRLMHGLERAGRGRVIWSVPEAATLRRIRIGFWKT